MIRYNPFKIPGMEYKFTELDRKIIFSAGLIILSSSLFKEYLTIYEKIKSKTSSNIKNLLSENRALLDDKYILF